MDVMLINAPILCATRDADSDHSVPPIGLGYIYTQLMLAGYQCRFVDAFASGLLPCEVVERIDQSDAEYVGLNVFSSNLSIVRSIVETVSFRRKFLLGGPAVRALLTEIRGWNPNGNVTVVAGESELILPEIIRRPTLAQRCSSKLSFVNVTPGSPFFPSNIDLPLDRSIFKNEPIHRQDLGLVESHVIASRGCLYNCAFCTAAKSRNPQTKPRYRTYNSLASEIETMTKLHPETTCIRVLDDLFLRDHASIKLATALFPEYHLHWRCMAHINTFRDLSSSGLDCIKKSGCRELFIGIESGNDETLTHIRKPFSAATAYETVRRILDAQIPVKCYFILGFPGETESALKDTLTLASKLRNYAAQIGVEIRISPFRFRPYPGTALHDELVKAGRTIPPISNRIDISRPRDVDPYDCVSGIYAEYDENTLNTYMSEMQALNPCSGYSTVDMRGEAPRGNLFYGDPA